MSKTKLPPYELHVVRETGHAARKREERMGGTYRQWEAPMGEGRGLA